VDLAVTPIMGVVAEIRKWLVNIDGETLNVAGPRASSDPAIYEKTRDVIMRLLTASC
jgi:hypothetical protein